MKRLLITFFILNILAIPLSAAEKEAEKPVVLEDGFLLAQVEGTVRQIEKTGAWRFSPEDAIQTPLVTIPPQTEFTLLPCRGLEKIIGFADQADSVKIRLRAIATRYHELNYLFVLDAVPVEDLEIKPAETEQGTPPQPPVSTDPNNFSSVLPPSVLERLKPKQRTDFQKMQQIAPGLEDRVLVSRTGRFETRGKTLFTLDGFGRNAGDRPFELLPCQTLEQTERDLQKAFGRRRYEVSGVVTTFQGRTFLLLQRARRTYTNGNLSP